MKKLIYILVGIFTFSIGFWLYHLRPLVMPVSLCEISQRDAELFKSKQIRIKAFLDGVGRTEGDSSYYSVFDYRNGCLTGADLEISQEIIEKLKSDESLNVSINLIRQKREEAYNNRRNENYPAGYYVAEVEIVGEIKKIAETSCGITMSCFANTTPPFIIKINEIKQVSPIRFINHGEISSITNLK